MPEKDESEQMNLCAMIMKSNALLSQMKLTSNLLALVISQGLSHLLSYRPGPKHVMVLFCFDFAIEKLICSYF